jgi:hypothetical protein
MADTFEIMTISMDGSKAGEEQAKQPKPRFFEALGPDIRREIYQWVLFIQEPTELSFVNFDSRVFSESPPKELYFDFRNVNCALFTLNKSLSQEALEFFYTK